MAFYPLYYISAVNVELVRLKKSNTLTAGSALGFFIGITVESKWSFIVLDLISGTNKTAAVMYFIVLRIHAVHRK